MASGSLRLRVTDLTGEPIQGKLGVDFKPHGSSAGGARMEANFPPTGATDFTVTNLAARLGLGTLYQLRISTKNFRSYAFFQLIFAKKVNTASENHIWLLTKPKRARSIDAPAFPALNAPLRRLLDAGAMQEGEQQDRDLTGLRGPALYEALGPLRKACLLNIFTKASHASSDDCFRFLRSLTLLRQDRCFCLVAPNMPEVLRRSERFKSAPKTLHKPLSGFRLEDSFKSRDAHANLQVTFMRQEQTGDLAADIDIDESSGLEHGFEVIRNALSGGRTNPYLIRELLLLFDPIERVLDPGYRFVYR